MAACSSTARKPSNMRYSKTAITPKQSSNWAREIELDMDGKLASSGAVVRRAV